jgi:RNA-directed DNA polymerase
MVNGPEDGAFAWLSVDWQRAEDDVRRLRQRIFTATQAGDLVKVRNLQRRTANRREGTSRSSRCDVHAIRIQVRRAAAQRHT